MFRVITGSTLPFESQMKAVASLTEFAIASNITIGAFNHELFVKFVSIICASNDIPQNPVVPDSNANDERDNKQSPKGNIMFDPDDSQTPEEKSVAPDIDGNEGKPAQNQFMYPEVTRDGEGKYERRSFDSRFHLPRTAAEVCRSRFDVLTLKEQGSFGPRLDPSRTVAGALSRSNTYYRSRLDALLSKERRILDSRLHPSNQTRAEFGDNRSVAASDGVISVVHDHLIQNQGRNPTCWAHAMTQVLIATQMRIDGRPTLQSREVVNYLLRTYPKGSTTFEETLGSECAKRFFAYNRVDTPNAIDALEQRRMVLGSFVLTTEEWRIFRSFFNLYPTNVLKFNVFKNPQRYMKDYIPSPILQRYNAKKVGHAVVITKYVPNLGFKVKNSWGAEWGKDGYAYIDVDAIPNGIKLYDVFFTLNGLPRWERHDLLSKMRHISLLSVQREYREWIAKGNNKMFGYDHWLKHWTAPGRGIRI